ncbi:MAG: flagellar hook basal-body protein [Desulfuromonadaceae bacterium]|nr:flagellar hook basal-body protein [Desulfuromonadaceae bacterium]
MGFSTAMMSGVSGLLSNTEALSVIGNNIANVNTVGFKSGRTLFSNMFSESAAAKDSQVGLGVQISDIENQFSQGSFIPSASPTDLAINGNGFFVVQDSSAKTVATYYTRAGVFNPDVTGTYLVNPQGAKLCDSTGVPIDLTTLTNLSSISKINQDGSITYLDTNGLEQTSVTKVGIASFINPTGLEKAGNNRYRSTLTLEGSGAAIVAAPDQDNKILFNTLEDSNVDMSVQMVNMITTQRAYSANSKSIITSDEMAKTVINLKR